MAVAIAVVHLAGLALAAWAFCRAFRRFFSAEDLIVPVMAMGIVFNLAAYIFSVIPVTWFDTREIPAVLPFGAVLAGRLLAETLARTWLRPVLAGVLACYALALGYGVAQPGRRQRAADRRLARGPPPQYRARHLHRGKHHHARQRGPRRGQDGNVAAPRAVPRAYESEASWYDPRLSYANFVVMNSADNPGRPESLIPGATSSRSPGPGAHLPLQDLHLMGLEPQPARRPGLPPVSHPRRHPLTPPGTAASPALASPAFRRLAE